ncbi:Nuclear pore complex protein [Nymphaea thermarum]|nr:Nuclear pore complex protein [Nymphaea thermarum]
MAADADMSGWSDLLHSSTKLLEQATPSAQFPPLQRNLEQLETLSKKLKAKTLRTETPSQSIAATRLLAREGINAEQLARDLKSFEIKTTFEDVFPSEATTVEEYLQQVHEMAMVSAVQEAQKDNLRCFNDYMMQVLELPSLNAVEVPASVFRLQPIRAVVLLLGTPPPRDPRHRLEFRVPLPRDPCHCIGIRAARVFCSAAQGFAPLPRDPC